MSKELFALSKLLNPKEDIYSEALYYFKDLLKKGVVLSWKNNSSEPQSLMFPQDFSKLSWKYKEVDVQFAITALVLNSDQFPVRKNHLSLIIFNQDECQIKLKKSKSKINFFNYQGAIDRIQREDAQLITVSSGESIEGLVKLVKPCHQSKDFLVNFAFKEDLDFWLYKITHLIRLNTPAAELNQVLLFLGNEEVRGLNYEETWNWFQSKKKVSINFEDISQLPFYYDALLTFFKESKDGLNKANIDLNKLDKIFKLYNANFLKLKFQVKNLIK